MYASEDESQPTSPPSSAAPSEDEFTSALIRHAARQLGVEFGTPQRRYMNSDHARDARDKPTGRQELPVLRFLPEILRQIEIRSKALGSNHRSLAELHESAGEQFAAERNFVHAESHLLSAVDIVESVHGTSSEEAIQPLCKLGQLYTSFQRYYQAQRVFERIVSITGNLDQGSQKLKAIEENARKASGLHAALLSWRQNGHMNKDTAAQAFASSLLLKRPFKPPTVGCDVGLQTEEFKSDAPPPPPPSVIITEAQRERLHAPTLRTASDLARLVDYVYDPSAMITTTTTRVVTRAHRHGSPRSDSECSVARNIESQYAL
jgi:hypothetical protein